MTFRLCGVGNLRSQPEKGNGNDWGQGLVTQPGRTAISQFGEQTETRRQHLTGWAGSGILFLP
jgi:hypothetical protein